MFSTTQPIALQDNAANKAVVSFQLHSNVVSGKVQRVLVVEAQRGVLDATGNFIAIGTKLSKTFSEAALSTAASSTDTPFQHINQLLTLIETVAQDQGF